MRPGNHRLAWFLCLVIAGVSSLMMINPAFAQDAGENSGAPTSYFQMFFWGGDVLGIILVWVLILMSVCVMALSIHYMLQNRIDNFLPEPIVEEVEIMLEEKRFREAIDFTAEEDSVFGQIMYSSLSEASNGFGAMERAVEETADLVSARKLRSLEYLNVLGAIGPMVGLFGTVYGMIVAFYQIVEKGGQPDPAELAGGISTALVTTFWGLIVGIPAVAAAALIRNKIDANTVETMIRSEELIGQFRPAKKKSSSSSKKPSEG